RRRRRTATIWSSALMITATRSQVTVLGAGLMGSALAHAFIKQGHTTTVWNRTPKKLQPLADLGARIAISPSDAVLASDVIVVILNDYATARDVLESSAGTGGLRGKILVQMASGSPKQARDLQAWASQHDAHYLDGAIMATPDLMGTPDAAVLYSGDADVFDRCRPTLAALGGNVAYVGHDAGHASALDSALLVVMWGAMLGSFQAAVICQAEGLDQAAYRAYLQPFLGHINLWVLDGLTRIEQGRLAADEATLATLATHNGALQALLDLCRERGINRELPDALNGLFQAAIKAGHAQHEIAVISQFMR
ncbi:MAG TPA: NAD(P)-binding domain-containing protein, partial [Steroidobacteraceae bacterium]|nr:NAD(P)-binding domain-containing protein [Steroidobacteraceae bacterium]